MITQVKKRKIGLAILIALFLLCITVFAVAPQTQPAFAENTASDPFTPTKFTTWYDEMAKGYTITGFDTSDSVWTGMTSTQKNNIAIVIPETHDGENGPLPVTAISNRAFEAFNYNCTFTSLDLSGATKLTTIGEFAFNTCNYLKTLKFPTNGKLTTIDKYAFYSCMSFTGSLTIPNTVKTIGESAFKGCENFTSLTFAEGIQITTIGDDAFSGCTRFTGSLTIPDTVTTIGNSAFRDCEGFTGSLEIPNSVKTIGNYAFSGCKGFTGALTISNKVKTIGDYAFNGCKGFTGSLEIPNSVMTIGDYAFTGCEKFTSLTFAEDSQIATIGEAAFNGCKGFTGSLTIPNSVTIIGNYAFSGCTSFTGSLTIPNSVTIIGNYAFNGCNGFTGSLTIPNSVTTIGEFAFKSCKKFTSLTFAEDIQITKIGDSAFYDCKGFTGSLTIPNSVTEIGDSAFYDCNGFTGSLTIPDSVTKIGSYAFLNCTSLETVYLPDNSTVEYSGADVFRFVKCPIVAPSNTEYNRLKELFGNSTQYLTYETMVTFDAGDGTVTGTAQQKKLFGYALSYEMDTTSSVWAENVDYALPSATKQNYIFKGWKTAGAEGEEVFTSTVVADSPTYNANYILLVLESISANLEQDGIKVYTSTSIENLKTILESALTVTGTYNNNTTENITDYTLSFKSGNAFTAGENRIVVTYKEKTAEIGVNVTQKALESIEITSPPTKKDYTAFETLNTNGMTVTARYNDGTNAAIQGYTVKYANGNDSFRVDDTSVTVAYTEENVEKTAEVLGITVTKKRLTKPAITGTYQYNGGEQTVNLSNFDAGIMAVDGNKNTDAVENKTVTVTLKDKVNCEWSDGGTDNLSLSWTISKATLTPNVSGITSKTYDGTTNATGTVNLSGAVNSELPTATATFTWTSANAGTATVNVSNITLGGSWTTNYTLSTNQLANQSFDTAKINKATLTPNVSGITSKTYDGTTTATGTIRLSGAVNNEQPTATANFTWTSAKAGTTTVNVSNITLGGSWTTNYTLSTDELNSQSFDTAKINKATLTPNVSGITSKTYDGTTTATGTIRLSGAVNNEQPTATGTFIWTNANAGTTTVNVSNITLGGAWTTNYTLSTDELNSQSFDTAKINKATLTPNVSGITSKTYDGTTTATGTVRLSGAVNGESPTATATFTWTSANAGTATVNVSNITLGGSWNTNYTLSTNQLANQSFESAKISAATITNNGAFANYSDSYDKTAHGISIDSEKITVINGQNITIYFSEDGATNWSTSPITYTDFTNGAKTIYWKVSAPNHSDITGSNTVTISKKAITVTAENKSSIHKADLAALTYTVSPALCTGDNFTGTLVTNADKNIVGNNYKITQGTLSAGDNYSITYVEAKYSVIAKATVSISQSTQSFTYNGMGKTFEISGTELTDFTVEYFVNGGYTSSAPINAGSYKVKVARAEDANNYAFAAEIENGLSISAATVAKPVKNNSSFIYSGEPIVYTLTDNEAYEITGNRQTEAGKYTVTVKLKNPQNIVNYKWTTGGTEDVAYDFVIGRKPTDKPVISGSYEYSGNLITANVVTTDAYTVAGNQKTYADTYTVTVTLTKNYEWNDGSDNKLELTWKIDRKKLSIIPSYGSVTKVFVGGTLPAISTEETVPGTIEWDEYSLTEAATNKEFGWKWTPDDTNNYAVIAGTVRFDVLTVQLESISAEFLQGGNAVYTSATLDSLKQYLTVYGTNNDGTSAGRISDYELSGDLKTDGEVTVTVRYNNKETTFKVNVTEVALESITAAFDPDGKEIYTSAQLESLKQYLTVTGKNNDGSAYLEEIEYTLSYSGGASALNEGNNTITVAFNGKTTAFDVTVTAVALKSIQATFTQGENTIYASATLDSLRRYLAVSGTNNDGSPYSETINYTLSGELTAEISEVTVTVNNTQIKDTFVVNVTMVKLAKISVLFDQGEGKIYTVDSLDSLKQYLTVNGTNNDGSQYTETIDYVLSGTLVAGNESVITVTVEDTEISATIDNIEVTAAIIVSIAVTEQPTKTAYTAKEDFDGNGMVITATFNYGTKVITDYIVENANNLQAGTTSLNIKYTFDGETKTTTVSVSVAKIQLAKPTVIGSYTYTGREQTVALNGFDEDTMSIVSGNKFTNAGDAYAVVIELKDAINYEWNDGSAENLSLSWAITKQTVTAPSADTTQFVYNGQEQTYAVAANDCYAVTGNKQTNANSWTVTVSLKDKSNMEWSDGSVKDVTFTFVIGKASFDMSGVTFDDVTVKEDGNRHKLEVSGLPDGVTVTYNGNNGYTADGVFAAGIYVVTATFTVTDTQNYIVPDAITKTLTINEATIIGGETNEKGEAEIVIDSNNGIKPGTKVQVYDKPPENYYNSNIVVAGESQSVMQVADIKLLLNGEEVQPDGLITVKMLIRNDLRGYDNLKVFYIAPDNSTEDMNAVREGDYLVFETTHFSVYAIAVPQSLVLPDNTGLSGGAIFGIVLAAIVVLIILFLLVMFLFRKNKSVGFKDFYSELGKTCTTGIKNIFKKDKV